jgi:hypothetical protein
MTCPNLHLVEIHDHEKPGLTPEMQVWHSPPATTKRRREVLRVLSSYLMNRFSFTSSPIV